MAGSQRYDAIVVGAGFAGLYMLHRLRGHGLSVRVFMPYLGFLPYVEKCNEVAAKGYEGFSLG
jgi:NADPH-dependent 2,4-dienoyl-CoA reductase/sulfur reductase-like enzyme